MNKKILMVLNFCLLFINAKKLSRKLILRQALTKINHMNQSEREIKFKNLERFL